MKRSLLKKLTLKWNCLICIFNHILRRYFPKGILICSLKIEQNRRYQCNKSPRVFLVTDKYCSCLLMVTCFCQIYLIAHLRKILYCHSRLIWSDSVMIAAWYAKCYFQFLSYRFITLDGFFWPEIISIIFSLSLVEEWKLNSQFRCHLTLTDSNLEKFTSFLKNVGHLEYKYIEVIWITGILSANFVLKAHIAKMLPKSYTQYHGKGKWIYYETLNYDNT